MTDLDLLFGRLGDLQVQIAALTDEVTALRAELQMPPQPTRSTGTITLPLVGECPVTLTTTPEPD